LTTIGSYQVKVQLQSAGEQLAVLSPATEEDMPNDWTFNWSSLWQRTDFDCQNIVKLVYSGQVWGLVRFVHYRLTVLSIKSTQVYENFSKTDSFIKL